MTVSSLSTSFENLPSPERAKLTSSQKNAIKTTVTPYKLEKNFHSTVEDRFKNHFFKQLTLPEDQRRNIDEIFYSLRFETKLISPIFENLQQVFDRIQNQLPEPYKEDFDSILRSNRFGLNKPDLLSFVLILKDLKKNKKKFYELISPIFASDPQFINTLLTWCDHEKIKSISDVTTFAERIDAIKMEVLPWQEDPNTKTPLNEIPSSEISLGLTRAEKIILNGELTEIGSNLNFFKALNQKINQKTEVNIDDQIDLFNQFSKVGWNSIYQELVSGHPNWRIIKENFTLTDEAWSELTRFLQETAFKSSTHLESKTIDTFLPICIPLRLATQGCWSYAHFLIINNFHSSLRFTENLTFSLKIESLSNYQLQQVKKYTLQNQAWFVFSWTISPTYQNQQLTWMGELKLIEFYLNEELTFSQKKEVLNLFFSQIPSNSTVFKKSRSFLFIKK